MGGPRTGTAEWDRLDPEQPQGRLSGGFRPRLVRLLTMPDGCDLHRLHKGNQGHQYDRGVAAPG